MNRINVLCLNIGWNKTFCNADADVILQPQGNATKNVDLRHRNELSYESDGIMDSQMDRFRKRIQNEEFRKIIVKIQF